jgi:uncharacterized membrane protein YkvA (DUF1232 family)
VEALTPLTPLEPHYLQTFSGWLNGMGNEVRALADLLERQDADRTTRRASAASLNYLLRSFELIPEGLEDLGYLDDLFAFRVLAEQAVRADPDSSLRDPDETLARLAADTGPLVTFLGEDFELLRAAALAVGGAEVKGRSVDDLLDDPELRAAALAEVRAWAEGYTPPELSGGEHELVKLRSFLGTKLRRAS